MDRIVIVGAGQGGLQAAISLRAEGFEGSIVLIGAEQHLPYQRPPLSKAFLKDGEARKLQIRPATFFERKDITLHTGVEVERIDRTDRVVWAGKESFAYDHLILATGTRNLRPPIPGLHHALDLRTLNDAQALRQALTAARSSVVIGGGFIGLEFAAVARSMGHDVCVAEAASRLMSRAVSPEMSARFLAKHRDAGTVVHLDNPVHSVTGEGVVLADGSQISADTVLLAAGVVPNTELAAAAGLLVDNGIVVNEYLLTHDDSISAMGDCAVFPNPVTGLPIRLESVQAATDHAKTIAARLVSSTHTAYAAVPWFWSDQSDWKLQIAGLAASDDDSVMREDGAVLRFANNHLSAVETINDARTHLQARKALAGALVSREQMAAVNYDLAAVK
ncbi:NAD(P)/FAD-dependent oxidoreductase [Granulosicoccus antarcticus]|uniref:Rhodocoxin reductase n=1 Tax=Granulosicoccus antarcticus IMCC3135 TaxID=1192854 RepID=A0A2Z2NZP1_9GAMM|nr:FAD-dependent oxidoreductase [Granulosicoccus antarcticus]ASJ74360.1 Rhodocoxin reductase [Granulosicoccus antarcticus IMCC3135]